LTDCIWKLLATSGLLAEGEETEIAPGAFPDLGLLEAADDVFRVYEAEEQRDVWVARRLTSRSR
jgi:hypothetical protein